MMIKTVKIIFLILFTQSVFAQESNYRLQDIKAEDVLQKGRYELDGAISITTGQTFTQAILGTFGYFLTNDFVIQSQAAIVSTTDQTLTAISLGGSYYFYKKNAFGLYATQYVGLLSSRSSNSYGETQLGVNYLVAPDVGFKVFGQLTYPFEDFDQNEFKILGALSYLF